MGIFSETNISLLFAKKIPDLASLGRKIAGRKGFREDELRSGSRKKGVSRARRLFCQLAVKEMGYSGAEVARYLGVTTSAVNRGKNLDGMLELRLYL